MKLHILFIQRKERYTEELAPEARIVWDEFALDENPEEFEKQCEQEIVKLGPDVTAHKVIVVNVSQSEVRRLLVETPELEGKVVDP